MIEARLAGHRAALIWPESQWMAHKDPSFLVYLPLEFGGNESTQEMPKGVP
jgi:hypothetical protein